MKKEQSSEMQKLREAKEAVKKAVVGIPDVAVGLSRTSVEIRVLDELTHERVWDVLSRVVFGVPIKVRTIGRVSCLK